METFLGLGPHKTLVSWAGSKSIHDAGVVVAHAEGPFIPASGTDLSQATRGPDGRDCALPRLSLTLRKRSFDLLDV